MRNYLPAGPARRRGRPRLTEPAIVCRLALTLRRGEDDDLIAFFEAMPVGGRPAAVKEALRGGVRGGGPGDGMGTLGRDESPVEALAAALEQLLA
jgi:hypothetical protein